MINIQTQILLDKFKEIPLFSEDNAILMGGTALAYHISHRESFIDTIIEYGITYLPKHIVQLIVAKEEDPFDVEGIGKPTMNTVAYQELKSFLLAEIREEK